MWYTVLILLALDIGGLLLVYVLLRDRVRRATTANAQIAEIRDEMSRLVVELNQTTDRNIALVEDRMASLNELLFSADKKIGLLHREIEKHDVGTQVYSRLAEGRPMRGAVTEAPSSLRTQEPPAMNDAGRGSVAGGAPQAGSSAARPAEGVPPRGQETQDAGQRGPEPRGGQESRGGEPAASQRGSEPRRVQEPKAGQEKQLAVELSERSEGGMASAGTPSGAPDLHQRVMMLHRSGFASSLIASRVGVPLGEVELIISLEQRKGRA